MCVCVCAGIAKYPDPANGSFPVNSTSSITLSDSELYLVAFGINFALFCFCLVGANMFAKCTNAFFVIVCGILLVTFIAMLSRTYDIAVCLA